MYPWQKHLAEPQPYQPWVTQQLLSHTGRILHNVLAVLNKSLQEKGYDNGMAEQETLEQILCDGHMSVQAETEARQQSWGFQGSFQQFLVVGIFRQLGWVSELVLFEEGCSCCSAHS